MKLRRVQSVNLAIGNQRSMLIISLTRPGRRIVTSVRWSSRLSSIFNQAATLVEDATAAAIGGYAMIEGDWLGEAGGHASL
jgi:hypothetical protein